MFKGLFFFIKNGWKYDKLYILWNIFYQLINAPSAVISTVFPKLIIDELTGQKRISQLMLYVAAFAVYMFLASSLSAYFCKDGFSRRCRVNSEFDSDLHRRLYECDYENLESSKFLDMQEKAKRFLYCNWHGFGYLLDCALNICGYLVTLIGIAAIIATLEIWIVLLFIAFAVTGAVIEGEIKKRVKRMDDELIANQRGWTYFSSLFEKSEYGKEFRIFHAGEWLLKKEREFFTRTNKAMKKQNDYYIFSGTITAFFTLIQQCISYCYLIYSVIEHDLSIGSFTMYSGAITVFASSFRQIMDSLVEIRTYDMYYTNLDEYLSVPKNMRAGTRTDIENLPHVIEFRNVSFKYPGSDSYALKNVSIKLTPGEKLMIAGENGVGKSTFINLLLRLYDPTEGEILLDGVNIRHIDYDQYLSLFSAVFQNFNLYSFSLKENVAMSESADDEKIEQILRKVGLGHKLSTLEHGINTPIHKNLHENGIEPSGGEAQKIAIARALYKNAPIVILDEPTAALDPRSEYEIYRQFNDLVRGRTAIYISHRLSSAKFCDHAAVFDHGCITEYGTHEQLIDLNGQYADFFKKQAEFYI